MNLNHFIFSIVLQKNYQSIFSNKILIHIEVMVDFIIKNLSIIKNIFNCLKKKKIYILAKKSKLRVNFKIFNYVQLNISSFKLF